MTEETNYLARFAVAAKKPFVRPKPAEPAAEVKDDEFLRKHLLKFRQSHPENRIPRETNGVADASTVDNFMEGRIRPADEILAAITSVVIPEHTFVNGRVVRGIWTPPISDEKKLAEIRLPHRPTTDKLPEALDPRPSQIEAATLYNLVKDLTEPVSVRSIRDGVRQMMMFETWPDQPAEYVANRLDTLIKMLLDDTVITLVADDHKRMTLCKVHRDRLTRLKNHAGPQPA